MFTNNKKNTKSIQLQIIYLPNNILATHLDNNHSSLRKPNDNICYYQCIV